MGGGGIEPATDRALVAMDTDLSEASDEARLPDAGVPDEDDFEQVVIVFHAHLGCGLGGCGGGGGVV